MFISFMRDMVDVVISIPALRIRLQGSNCLASLGNHFTSICFKYLILIKKPSSLFEIK